MLLCTSLHLHMVLLCSLICLGASGMDYNSVLLYSCAPELEPLGPMPPVRCTHLHCNANASRYRIGMLPLSVLFALVSGLQCIESVAFDLPLLLTLPLICHLPHYLHVRRVYTARYEGFEGSWVTQYRGFVTRYGSEGALSSKAAAAIPPGEVYLVSIYWAMTTVRSPC